MAADRETLEEAARWFAQRREPDNEASRTEFDAWLAADPRNREAYSQISEVFSLGKNLTRSKSHAQDRRSTRATRGPGYRLAAFVAVATALAGTAWLAIGDRQGPARPVASRYAKTSDVDHHQELVTRRGQIRTFHLPDGSYVILDTDSLVSVSFDTRGRRLLLERGRARFDVAHERRPFVVAAAGGLVTAHGTIFDVRLIASKTIMVRLLRGAIDVDMPSGPQPGSGNHSVTRLRPGQAMAFSATTHMPVAEKAAGDGDEWPAAMRELEAVRLADFVAEANRYASTPIALASPAIGELRLSGTFRIDDTRRLADNLATIVGLQLDLSHPSRILLKQPCGEGLKIKCSGPS